MNLSLQSNEDDRVALAHVAHTISDLTQVRDFLENAGFHILEATKKLNGTDTYSHQIPLNGGYISFEATNNSYDEKLVFANISGFGLKTPDIEGTQGRLTLHGFHPLAIDSQQIQFLLPGGNLKKIEYQAFGLKKDNIREGNVEFIEIATSNNSLSNLPHKNLINRLHAIILCTDNPEETIARYCWLTNQSSPKRIFDESWQIQLGQQSIVVCAQKESNRLALDVGSFNTPSILGYALLTNNLTKTNDFFSDNQTLIKSLKGRSIFAKFPDFIGGNLIIAENILHFPWNEGFD